MSSNSKTFINFLLTFFITFLSFEKIKLSWEIAKLHQNHENLQVEYNKFKDHNLKLITQYHSENSIAIIEKQSKEVLGMLKKKPITIRDNEKGK